MICRLYAPHIGGVEKHVSGISREAIKDGHHVDVFTLKHDSQLKSEEVIDGVNVHRVTANGGKIQARIEIWSWMLAHILTFIQADVIQIHDVFFWYWPIRILFPWKKVYITYHGFEPSSVKTSAGEGRELYIDPKAKRTRQMIQRWTSGSMAVGYWIEKWYGTKPDEVTYGGGECLPNFKIQLPKSKKIRGVFVGRISQDTGARIYENVIRSLDNCQLDMFGPGSKLGTIDDSCAVFPQYDIACVSSYLAIVEAMQCRTLVVAYAADELKVDYLMAHPRSQDMVIVRSELELKQALTLIKSEDYTKQIDDAYQWARQQTWNRVYLKYKKLWKWN